MAVALQTKVFNGPDLLNSLHRLAAAWAELNGEDPAHHVFGFSIHGIFGRRPMVTSECRKDQGSEL